MRHVSEQANLAGIARLAGKIGARDDIDAIRGVDACVVRDEISLQNRLLKRVSPVDDLDALFRGWNHFRANVLQVGGTVCECKDTIQLGQSDESIANLTVAVQDVFL